MSGKSKITFAESAVNDLEEILYWYIKQEVPNVGNRLVMDIMSQVERLEIFPESGRIVPEFGMSNLREIVFPPYRIIYRVFKAYINVVRVWRSERNLEMPFDSANHKKNK